MATRNRILANFLVLIILVLECLGSVFGQNSSSNIRCFGWERQALLKLKDELVDESGRLSSWGVGRNQMECCEWSGVRCDNVTNHVTQLSLRTLPRIFQNGPSTVAPLRGKISSSLLELKHLTYLDLSLNDFGYSNIPEFIGSFEKLQYLNLSFANFHGSIPPSVGNLSELIYLDFSSNSGLFSENLGWVAHLGSLEYLDLSVVELGKASNWLHAISKSTSIKELHLANCGLIDQGILPSSLPSTNSSSRLSTLDLSTNPDLTIYPLLERLFLSDNMFNGPLNENIGSLSEMKVLDLSSNNFEGIVTESHLFNQSRLRMLDLSFNPQLTVNCSSQWIPPFQLILLRLSNCKVGPRFPQWLRNQNILDYIDFSSSQIVDTIPHWIGHLASRPIRLNLSNNQIHGVFPKIGFSIFNLSSYMSSPIHDRVTGMILDLSRNKVTGEATFLCQSEEWILIDLSNNLFFGHLPNCFANSTRIRFLNLANNKFSGTIPSSFGSLPLLSLLNLRNNSFSGGIPTSLRSCTGLQLVDLGENRLTGIIPTWIGDDLLSLIVLSLRLNEFRGIIPSSICNLQIIQVLDLSLNKISGVIPKCLDNLTAMTAGPESKQKFSNLVGTPLLFYTLQDVAFFMWKRQAIIYVNHNIFVELIDLSSNGLIGDIPPEITKLVGLNSLNLSKNSLSGQIPANIGLLKYLDSLDLSRNHLSGGIPASLSELNFLGILDLTYNNLSGRIPPLNFGGSSYTGNPGLCGRLALNKSCPDENENTHQDSNFNGDAGVTYNLKHEEDELITIGFYICMGFGFVLGFWGILGLILLNKSARSAYFKLLDAIEDFVYMRGKLK